MSTHTVRSIADTSSRPSHTEPMGAPRGFAIGLFILAAALVINTVLGPLGTETIRYPITGTLLNQTIGLEVVTVGLVVPLTVLAGVLALRGHVLAPFLGFAGAAYSAYMFVQYVLGPEYSSYTPTVLFQTLIFTLSGALTVSAWVLGAGQPMPRLTDGRRRSCAVILLLLGTFIVSRYLHVIGGGALPAEFTQARTFYWSIFLLDLGVIVPATAVAGIGLLRGARLGQPAMYALMGWYALVPPSVAAMSATMVINDDPHAAPGQAVVFAVVAVLAVILAIWILAPLVHAYRTGPARRSPLRRH